MYAIKGRRIMHLALMLLVLLLPGVAAAAQTGSGVSMPEQAVSILLMPFQKPSAGITGCNAVTGQLADCPITARLRQRLEQATENGNILIRAQNPPRSVTVKLISNDGQTAQVAAIFDYGTGSYSITFTVIKQADGWLVDDSFCTAEPGSSIYNAPTGPCPLDTGSGGIPGMPGTGEGSFPALVVLALAGAVLLASAGLLLQVASGHLRSRR